MKKTLILVLGMHRSGTSAVTRMLNLLGAELGEKLLEAQQGVNEKGFWEHQDLVRLNEDLLAALGSSWYDFRPLPQEWWKQPALKPFRKRAGDFLNQVFADRELSVMKDPRLCVLMPFWASAARKQGWRCAVVMVTRAPWEVAASLCKRDPLDESTANLLWLRYSHDADLYSRDVPRAQVDYQQVLTGWSDAIDHIRELWNRFAAATEAWPDLRMAAEEILNEKSLASSTQA